MSFSTAVKDELIRQDVKPALERARIYSYLRLGSVLIVRRSGVAVRFKTKSIDLVKEVLKLFRDLSLEASLVEKKNPRNDKRPIYMIEVVAPALLSELGLVSDNGFPRAEVNQKIMKSANAKAEFLRAGFLFHGSINDPLSSRYHLEIVYQNEADALFSQEALARYQIYARIITRAKGYVLYVKSAESILDFLKMLGANETMFAFADSKIKRDMNNVVNRMMNCDIANEVKAQKAARVQLEAIDIIMKTSYMATLSTRLQDAVRLRLEHRESSLTELSGLSLETVGREISRSALAHCYRDILATAELVKEKGNKE